MDSGKKFPNGKLENIFPQTLSYHFQSLTTNMHIGKANFDIIKKTLDDFKSAVRHRRSEYPGLDGVLNLLDYPMDRLEKHFMNTIVMDNQEVYIYKFYIEKQFDELILMAKDFDKGK